MNTRMLATSLVLSGALVGCGKEPAKPIEVKLDPLSSFKVIAEKCQGAFNASDNLVPGKTGGFVRIEITPGPMSFDVKKTDSLVSPYTAYIDLTFAEKALAAPTEEAARAWDGVAIVTMQHWRLLYALQDGKWTLQEELYSFAMPSAGITEQAPTKMSAGAISKRVPSALSCTPSQG
ncbi:MAG TPA: hypothetical protein GXX48_14900 [Ochrobactrum intermedium]|uniref:Lipoprotein n=1 Tax=Brucella intermedia TaxID=94625 RepID=A0A7V6PDE1_9HYPH|nr:hypothetical protein [Brucella intermedia]HHV68919.1 hypothetical protein [Brucella intermedia]